MADITSVLPVSKDRTANAQTNPLFVRLTDGTDASLIDGSGNLNVVVNAAIATGDNTIGRVKVTDGTDLLEIVLLDYDSGAGTQNLPVFGIALPASGGAVSGGTSTNPIRIDPTGTTAQPVTDNAGSLTVDAPTATPVPTAVTTTGDVLVKPGDSANNAIRVNIVAGASAGGTSQADESTFTEGTTQFTPVGGVFNDTITSDPTEDQAAAARITAKRALHTNLRNVAGTEIGVQATPVFTRHTDGTNNMPSGDNAARSIFVRLTDGTDALAIDASGRAQVDIAAQTLTAVAVSKNGSANAETNPIYVQTVQGTVLGGEVHSYNTAAAVSSGGTSNHDYTVTTAKTLLLKQVWVTASGAVKALLQVGPVAALVDKMVGFSSMANPNIQMTFDPPVEVPDTSTGTVRVIRTNREDAAMDVYSTVVGVEV